jgi:hypothetical protein
MKNEEYNFSEDPKELLAELLYELRIDKTSLNIMAEGHSPNRPGTITHIPSKKYYFPYPVVQLSQKLAEDISKLDIEWLV